MLESVCPSLANGICGSCAHPSGGWCLAHDIGRVGGALGAVATSPRSVSAKTEAAGAPPPATIAVAPPPLGSAVTLVHYCIAAAACVTSAITTCTLTPFTTTDTGDSCGSARGPARWSSKTNVRLQWWKRSREDWGTVRGGPRCTAPRTGLMGVLGPRCGRRILASLPPTPLPPLPSLVIMGTLHTTGLSLAMR